MHLTRFVVVVIRVFFFLSFDSSLNSSKNGTPIEAPEDAAIIATVTKAKKRRTGSTGDGAASASLDINIGGGQFLSLQDPNNIASLDGHEKNMAIQQLNMLRDQVDFYLKRMEGN